MVAPMPHKTMPSSPTLNTTFLIDMQTKTGESKNNILQWKAFYTLAFNYLEALNINEDNLITQKLKSLSLWSNTILKVYPEAKDLGGCTLIAHRADQVAVSQTAGSHTYYEPQAARKEVPALTGNPIRTASVLTWLKYRPKEAPALYTKFTPESGDEYPNPLFINNTNYNLDSSAILMQMITKKTTQFVSQIPHIHHITPVLQNLRITMYYRTTIP